MASERIVVGLDVGTTKVCTIVAEVGAETTRILGLGIEPAQGMSKGTVVDVALATEAVRRSKRAAERTSGYEIGRAFVSVAGKHIAAINSQGVTGPHNGIVGPDDVERALDAARAVNLPHNREVLHVIPRTFTVDGQDGIHNPVGMHAFRLEVEAHIITAASSSLLNLEKCVNDAGLSVDRFVLNPLASAETVLSDAERDSGVVVVDIGGGTTDLAVFIDGTVWHSAVIEVGGNHVTNDVAHVLHLPTAEAERIKIDDGNALPEEVNRDDILTVQPFGEEQAIQIYRHDLALIIEARVEEIFSLVIQELKRSGFDGLLPAGVALTGGTAALRNIRHCASKVMNMPARVALPEGLSGLTDKLNNPAYATAVGLLRFGHRVESSTVAGSGKGRKPRRGGTGIGKIVGDFLGRLLPD